MAETGAGAEKRAGVAETGAGAEKRADVAETGAGVVKDVVGAGAMSVAGTAVGRGLLDPGRPPRVTLGLPTGRIVDEEKVREQREHPC